MQSAINKLPIFLRIGLIVLLIVLGSFMLAWSQIKPYQLNVNGETIHMRAIAFYPRDLFDLANVPLQPEDRISVDPIQFSLAIPEQVSLLSARPVNLIARNGQETVITAELIPANILQRAGIKLYPGDILL
ncbi:MAG: hypothetical protein PHS75_10525, partial [Anaerolineaceae bacterium]|nr:hypothetical protein [Anaerolineaceae bacterium]